jgi:hypothetical protein
MSSIMTAVTPGHIGSASSRGSSLLQNAYGFRLPKPQSDTLGNGELVPTSGRTDEARHHILTKDDIGLGATLGNKHATDGKARHLDHAIRRDLVDVLQLGHVAPWISPQEPIVQVRRQGQCIRT